MYKTIITGSVRVMIALLVMAVMLFGVKMCQMARAHYVAEPAITKNVAMPAEK